MYFQKRNSAASVPISTFICLWSIYIFPRSAHLFSCSRIGRPIREIHKSLTETWIGTVAAQCLAWEYLFQIFGIVSLHCMLGTLSFILKSSSSFFLFHPTVLRIQYIASLQPLVLFWQLNLHTKWGRKKRDVGSGTRPVRTQLLLLLNSLCPAFLILSSY